MVVICMSYRSMASTVYIFETAVPWDTVNYPIIIAIKLRY